MIRRQAIAVLLGSLQRLLNPSDGAALLLDIRTRQLISTNKNLLTNKILLPPGSTLKPFTLAALSNAGKLSPEAEFACPGTLTLAGRRMNCSHPRTLAPMRIETALAYSCNNFVAHQAARLAPGELASLLQPYGFTVHPITGERQQLQAIGEDSVTITPEGLLRAYRQLALQVTEPVLKGLEGAVEFGTGQRAKVAWAKVAGKTGSTHATGQFIAWFAGFAPSRAPEVAVLVMLSGKHGGSDAAPLAAEILNEWHAKRA